MPKTLTNLDLDLVRTFTTIASIGNFTRAAETLRRQQSTISLQVQRLESALGPIPLHRLNRADGHGGISLGKACQYPRQMSRCKVLGTGSDL
jgi:hypothetical protein